MVRDVRISDREGAARVEDPEENRSSFVNSLPPLRRKGAVRIDIERRRGGGTRVSQNPKYS